MILDFLLRVRRAACCLASAVVFAGAFTFSVNADTPLGSDLPLVTGKRITPAGKQTEVGSIPIAMTTAGQGSYVLVESMGERAYVSVLSALDGHLVSRVGFNRAKEGQKNTREGLYYGLAVGPARPDGSCLVFASRGSDSLVSVLTLAADGVISNTRSDLPAPCAMASGLALDAQGLTLYVADNSASPDAHLRGAVKSISLDGASASQSFPVAGYPYALAAVTRGAQAGRKLYVSCEQGGVYDIDPSAGAVREPIRTGDHPLALLLNRRQTELFVTNANDDTVSVVDTSNDQILRTILLRPAWVRGLPGATPHALALSPDETTLYAALADFNAVAVIDVASGVVRGYIPAGWYPTALSVSGDGARLFVANAKGVAVRTPNDKPTPYEPNSKRAKFIQLLLEGTVSTIDLKAAEANLPSLTDRVLANNMIARGARLGAGLSNGNPGIKHVIYIVKENRTYDQVFGDIETGNGDPSLALFGRNVTPNQHALAQRFVLLDNFYCCGEVSGDGWVWSTAGMANPYVERNVPYGYTQHKHPYDYEGLNNGVAPDIAGVEDVSEGGGGYLWDDALRHRLAVRNYGFFSDDHETPRVDPDKGSIGPRNDPNRKSLVAVSDTNFRQTDLNYTDSDAWVKWSLPPSPKQMTAYGAAAAPCRFTEWKREFDRYVAGGDLPQISFVRLPCDHTCGTTPGSYAPAAMVADNDYAVGELVDAVSRSPYWISTAIFVVEDDAQNGSDHVDAHRSNALVISPYIAKGLRDSRFYNTDSILRTIEALLGLDPMCQYDAIAPPIDVFGTAAGNAAPFDAVLPDRAIVSQVNLPTAYRAQDSIRFFNPHQVDSGPADQMNDIIWRAVKGVKSRMPAPHHAFMARPERDPDDG